MKNYFSLLDPLRFGAALFVAVFHLMFYSWAGASIGAPQGFEQFFAADVQFPNAAPYTWFGWVGVEIFFVISGFVVQRTNEFGIRFALGAAARDVIGLVMKEGLRLAVVGLVVGLGLSFAITRLMRRLLFEVSPTDPWLYSGVALFICSVAALACFVPALRATRIDPMQALRTE